MEIGKIAASAAGDQDLLADAPGAFQHGHAPSALARLDGAHEPSRTAAENDDVKVLFHAYQASGALEWMSMLQLLAISF